MRVIILSNNPTAREVFALACSEQAMRVFDFRMQEPGFGHRNGLHYSLGHRYGLHHHSQLLTIPLKSILRWHRLDLPMIVIVDNAAQAGQLRYAIRANYPLTQIEYTTPS